MIKLTHSSSLQMVILTHHSPTWVGTLPPEIRDKVLQHMHSTNLEALFQLPVVSWAFGNTNRSSDQGGWPPLSRFTKYSQHFPPPPPNNLLVVNGVRLISNQLGYLFEDGCNATEFDPSRVIDIDNPPTTITTRQPTIEVKDPSFARYNYYLRYLRVSVSSSHLKIYIYIYI